MDQRPCPGAANPTVTYLIGILRVTVPSGQPVIEMSPSFAMSGGWLSIIEQTGNASVARATIPKAAPRLCGRLSHSGNSHFPPQAIGCPFTFLAEKPGETGGGPPAAAARRFRVICCTSEADGSSAAARCDTRGQRSCLRSPSHGR